MLSHFFAKNIAINHSDSIEVNGQIEDRLWKQIYDFISASRRNFGSIWSRLAHILADICLNTQNGRWT